MTVVERSDIEFQEPETAGSPADSPCATTDGLSSAYQVVQFTGVAASLDAASTVFIESVRCPAVVFAFSPMGPDLADRMAASQRFWARSERGWEDLSEGRTSRLEDLKSRLGGLCG